MVSIQQACFCEGSGGHLVCLRTTRASRQSQAGDALLFFRSALLSCNGEQSASMLLWRDYWGGRLLACAQEGLAVTARRGHALPLPGQPYCLAVTQMTMFASGMAF